MSDVPEMIERVARALATDMEFEPDEIVSSFNPKFRVPRWMTFVDHARAAINAIREPSEVMVEAAWPNIMHENARDVWQDMVDAALGNPPVAR